MNKFTIPGKAQPKERARYSPKSGRWYTPRKTQGYEKTVCDYALASGCRLGGDALYSLELDFFPDRTEVKIREALAGSKVGRSDLDNRIKAVTDGIQAAYKADGFDDRQIVRIVATERGGES